MTSKVLSKLFQPHSLLTAQLANKNKYWLANTPTFTAQIIQCFSFSNKVFLKIKSLKKKKKKKKKKKNYSVCQSAVYCPRLIVCKVLFIIHGIKPVYQRPGLPSLSLTISSNINFSSSLGNCLKM